jgi:hypothetical protein
MIKRSNPATVKDEQVPEIIETKPVVAPVVRRRAPSKPRVTTTSGRTVATKTTPVTQSNTRRKTAVKVETAALEIKPEVPAEEEQLSVVSATATETKPKKMKDKDKEKKEKKKKNKKAKAKKEKSQKKKAKKKAKAKKKKNKKKGKSKKKK